MKKRRGLFGLVQGLIVLAIVCALILAILPKFNWDILSFFEWCFEWFMHFVKRIAKYFQKSDTFNDVFDMKAGIVYLQNLF